MSARALEGDASADPCGVLKCWPNSAKTSIEETGYTFRGFVSYEENGPMESANINNVARSPGCIWNGG
jgi:hypothetical protein